MPTPTSDDRLHYRPLPPRRRTHDHGWVRRALIFLTCCVLANSLFGEAGVAAAMRARRSYAKAAAQLLSLRNTNAGLREQVRRLSSDPGEIEGVARTELGLIRPGEMLFVIRDVQ
jgi:cell division protein FtsB